MRADGIFGCLIIFLVEWVINGGPWNTVATKLCCVYIKWYGDLCKLSSFQLNRLFLAKSIM